jgi:hypothetical protein
MKLKIRIQIFCDMTPCLLVNCSQTLQSIVVTSFERQAKKTRYSLSERTNLHWGTRWRSWLRHCATSRRVASSIPDGFTEIFH